EVGEAAAGAGTAAAEEEDGGGGDAGDEGGGDGGFSFRPPRCAQASSRLHADSCSRFGGDCGGDHTDGAANGHPHAHSHHHHHHHRRRYPRYLHLPVQHFKHSRTSLQQHLQPALSFLSHHLGRGRTVLIHDTNGLDTCVCVAVALLLACYGPVTGGSGPSTPPASSADSSSAAPAPSHSSLPMWVAPYRCEGGVGVPAAAASETSGSEATAAAGGAAAVASCCHVSKDAVRQRLAYVSAWYPPARPTRGMLRQVFNHFVRAGAGMLGAEAE
ncbi:hypothetical protein Agub_g4460, partial [Astrephomene gubernaculifera]